MTNNKFFDAAADKEIAVIARHFGAIVILPSPYRLLLVYVIPPWQRPAFGPDYRRVKLQIRF